MSNQKPGARWPYLFLQIRNPEKKRLTLDYMDYVWDDVIGTEMTISGMDIGVYPQTDYFDVLLRSQEFAPVNYYYLFRFDFVKEEVTLLSQTTMTSLVIALLGGMDSDSHRFYEYTLEKTLTEDMVVIPEGGELVDSPEVYHYLYHSVFFLATPFCIQ